MNGPTQESKCVHTSSLNVSTARVFFDNSEILKYSELIVDKSNFDVVQCGYFLAEFAGEYDKEPLARERHFVLDNDSAKAKRHSDSQSLQRPDGFVVSNMSYLDESEARRRRS